MNWHQQIKIAQQKADNEAAAAKWVQENPIYVPVLNLLKELGFSLVDSGRKFVMFSKRADVEGLQLSLRAYFARNSTGKLCVGVVPVTRDKKGIHETNETRMFWPDDIQFDLSEIKTFINEGWKYESPVMLCPECGGLVIRESHVVRNRRNRGLPVAKLQCSDCSWHRYGSSYDPTGAAPPTGLYRKGFPTQREINEWRERQEIERREAIVRKSQEQKKPQNGTQQ